MSFFIVEDVREGKIATLKGALIVDAIVEIDSNDPKASGQSKPKPKIPKLLELKWILPPKDSPAYKWVKEAAEAAGYETVEHDDFSYPRPLG